MGEDSSYETLRRRVEELERELTRHRRAERMPFDSRGQESLLYPDWPEARWNISGLFIRRPLLSHLVATMAQAKLSHALRSFHDAPDVIWNGGRINNGVRFHDDAEKYFKSLNARGIGVFLTFTNLVLEKKHLDDDQANRVLDCLDETCGLNGVIVANDLLSDYLRDKKPGLKQVCSVVKSFVENPEGRTDWYREMQRRFDRVVVHTDHMFDLNFLDTLDRSKSEILITEECLHNCPNRQRHQMLISQYNLNRSPELYEEMQQLKKTSCKGGPAILNDEKALMNARSCFLTRAEVKAIYDMGFRDFKISGRRKPVGGLAWNLVHFLFNPDMAYVFAGDLYNRIDRDMKNDIKRVLNQYGVFG
jgi:hypothetical protein